MTMYDTLGRVLLGTAFGFVMGIVMYQAGGINVGIINSSSVKADILCAEPKPNLCGGDTCCWVGGCTGGVCHNPNANCSAYADPACFNCPDDDDGCAECLCQSIVQSYPIEVCDRQCKRNNCCDMSESPGICRYY